MTRHAFTARQQEMLDCIGASLKARGYPPTLREIGASMGIRSTNAVSAHLDALARKGALDRARGRSRAITLIEPPAVLADPPALVAPALPIAPSRPRPARQRADTPRPAPRYRRHGANAHRVPTVGPGAAIREARLAAGLSLDEVAVLVGLSPEMVGRAERGKGARVGVREAIALALAAVAPRVPNTLGEVLRAARLRAGLTQEALAARLGVHFYSLTRWECDRSRPRPPVLRSLGTALGMDVARWLPAEG